MQEEPRKSSRRTPPPVGGVDHVALDGEVLVDELGREGVVGVDSADLGGGQVDLVRSLGFHEFPDGRLVEEVELGPRP